MAGADKFTVEEFKNARTIFGQLKVPENKQALIDQASREFKIDQGMYDAMREQFDGYITKAIKIIDDAPVIKENLFSEEIMPPDSEVQKVGERLAVLEYGSGVIMRGLYNGTLTQNEIDAFNEFYPDQAQSLAFEFITRMNDPEMSKNMPQQEKELVGSLIGVEVMNPLIVGALAKTYEKEDEEEKPGPKSQPQWVEGRFPATQLAGSYAVEQRRNT
ncbi:hypothetical protein CMI37_38950 [Candidatus Pacearchaeota archaeon]|nr:hypothetical protein [Candidatus Pacearchaeota archaeon]|tara:strand:- start:13 stop:663 length:651 start_codon:yes stop_codon:yes gene_type:complete